MQHGLGQPQTLPHTFAVLANQFVLATGQADQLKQSRAIACESSPRKLGLGDRRAAGRAWRYGGTESSGFRANSRCVAARPANRPGSPRGSPSPALQRTIPNRILISVVLPAPLGPSNPNTSPRRTVKSIPLEGFEAALLQPTIAVRLAHLLDIDGRGVDHRAIGGSDVEVKTVEASAV